MANRRHTGPLHQRPGAATRHARRRARANENLSATEDLGVADDARWLHGRASWEAAGLPPEEQRGQLSPPNVGAQPPPRAVGSSNQMGVITRNALQIFGTKTSVLGDACEHARADFLAVVKGENEVWPAQSGHRSMRARLTLDLPSKSEKSSKNTFGL